MQWIIVYFSTAVVMLPLDFAFLGTIGKKMFDQNVGDMVTSTPRVAPAGYFLPGLSDRSGHAGQRRRAGRLAA